MTLQHVLGWKQTSIALAYFHAHTTLKRCSSAAYDLESEIWSRRIRATNGVGWLNSQTCYEWLIISSPDGE